MKTFVLSLILTLTFCVGTVVFAQDSSNYTPIVTIPGMKDFNSSKGGVEQYINALYILTITIASILAVVKIIFGGVKWMLSDVITDKSAAKKDIRGALLGLLIVLSAVLILNTINVNLTNLNIFQNAPELGPLGGPDLSDTGAGTVERQRIEYPVIKSLYSGTMGSTAHTSFLSTCRAGGGVVVPRNTVGTTGTSGTLECRGK